MTTLDLTTITLDKGSHNRPDEGHCLLEVVSMLAGGPFGDSPACVSPVLRRYGIALNDAWDHEQRQRLLPFAPRLLNTAGDGRDKARSFLALDWLIRTYTPAWLDLAGLTAEAAELRSLRRIVDLVAAQAAGPVVRHARDAAGAAAGAAARDAAGAAARDAAGAAAGDAAWDAARDAAGAAARDAAWDAAWDAAGAAAWDAAWDAARAAAWDAAGAAARDALRPTVDQLQASALDLFDRMIEATA